MATVTSPDGARVSGLYGDAHTGDRAKLNTAAGLVGHAEPGIIRVCLNRIQDFPGV